MSTQRLERHKLSYFYYQYLKNKHTHIITGSFQTSNFILKEDKWSINATNEKQMVSKSNKIRNGNPRNDTKH